MTSFFALTRSQQMGKLSRDVEPRQEMIPSGRSTRWCLIPRLGLQRISPSLSVCIGSANWWLTSYTVTEEGVFYADDLPATERKVLESYITTAVSDVASFPPRFPLYSRSEFMKRVFWPAIKRDGALVCRLESAIRLGAPGPGLEQRRR
jgi:hypothetical protein